MAENCDAEKFVHTDELQHRLHFFPDSFSMDQIKIERKYED